PRKRRRRKRQRRSPPRRPRPPVPDKGQPFGAATMGTPVEQLPRVGKAAAAAHRRPRVRAGTAIYDCGKFGWLTAKQIAAIAGTSKTAIYKRLDAGVRGDALCDRRWANQSKVRRDSPPRRHSLVLALRIATLFPDRLPTLEEIKALRTMSDQNAQVWRQAI